MGKIQHRIIVRDEIFGAAIEVIVTPAPAGVGHDREFSSLTAARKYASQLSAATSWTVHDLVGEDAP